MASPPFTRVHVVLIPESSFCWKGVPSINFRIIRLFPATTGCSGIPDFVHASRFWSQLILIFPSNGLNARMSTLVRCRFLSLLPLPLDETYSRRFVPLSTFLYVFELFGKTCRIGCGFECFYCEDSGSGMMTMTTFTGCRETHDDNIGRTLNRPHDIRENRIFVPEWKCFFRIFE